MITIPASVPRTAACLCRQIPLTVTGPPDHPHTCSCRHCPGLSGGPMTSWVSFPLDGVKWTGDGGEPSWHSTWPDSKRGFCPSCGSQLCALDDGATSIAITDDQAELVTCCRTFHWMTRTSVLALADRVAAPGADVAITGDASPWTHQTDWTSRFEGPVRSRTGPDRRAGTTAAHSEPGRRPGTAR